MIIRFIYHLYKTMELKFQFQLELWGQTKGLNVEQKQHLSNCNEWNLQNFLLTQRKHELYLGQLGLWIYSVSNAFTALRLVKMSISELYKYISITRDACTGLVTLAKNEFNWN